MATIKSYTDLSQSKKLAEILPLESADMYWDYDVQKHEHYLMVMDEQFDDTCVRAWSLAALIEQLPYEVCDDDGNSSYLQMDKEDDVYQLVYTDPHGDFESIETDRYEHFVDACYEMIIKLSKLSLL